MFSSKDLFFTPAAGGYTVSKSLRFRSSASAYLYRTFGSPTNQIKWTYSFWYKRGKLSTAMDFICSPAGSGQKYFDFLINASDQLVFQYGTSGTSATNMTTAPVLRDPSAWYHIVLSVDLSLSTNRVRIYLNNAEITAGTPPGQNDTSYLFNTAVQHTIMSEWNGGSTYSGFHDGYITEVNFIDGQQLTPSSFGAYDTNGIWQPTAYSGSGYGNNGFYLKFTDTTSTTALGYDSNVISTTVSSAAYFSPTGGVSQSGITFQSGTSVSNFYNGLTTDNICYNNPVNAFLALDAGIGNTLNLTKWGFYLRNASANETWSIQYSSDGSSWSNAATGFSPSAAGWNDVTFSSVGSYRYWRAIVTTQVNGEYYTEYRVYGTGTYNNANNWTPANISLTSGTTYDSMLDSPTNATGDIGNYCTINPINGAASYHTVTNANLTFNGTSTTQVEEGLGTFSLNSGTWYFEVTVTNVGAGSWIGISTDNGIWRTASNAVAYGYFYTYTGQKYINNSGSAYGASYTTGDVIGVAIDFSTPQITFYKNGSSQGNISIAAGSYFPSVAFYGTSAVVNLNFGQRPFVYSNYGVDRPASTFLAINTQNLSTPTITNGAQYMAAVLYNGTSASNTVTASSTNSGNNPNGTTFQPDLVWIKSRSAATDHKLTDVVRGTTKALITDTTGAQTTDTNGLTAFTSNGFTVGSDSNYNNGTGPATYIAWEWKAGNSSGSSNTSGTITSTVSANATAGFSIATYVGNGTNNSTVGHGLGAIPSLMIIKRTDGTNGWDIYHASNGAQKYMDFTTAGVGSLSTIFPTTPTSSVFYIGSTGGQNTLNGNYVAYLWAPISNYSSFGQYTGNSSADGVYVYTGFRPRWLLIKGTGSGGSGWMLLDTSRDTYNVSTSVLRPDLNAAASTGYGNVVDILSNGFKLRSTDTNSNSSSTTYGPYIYAAFAENPFKISRAV